MSVLLYPYPYLMGLGDILNSTLAMPGWMRGRGWEAPKGFPVERQGTTIRGTPGILGEVSFLHLLVEFNQYTCSEFLLDTMSWVLWRYNEEEVMEGLIT